MVINIMNEWEKKYEKDWEQFKVLWEKNNEIDNFTKSLVPPKRLRNNLIFSHDWQTNEVCKRYCNIEDILMEHEVKNSNDLNERLEKAELFDYLMSHVKNVEYVDYANYYYMSFYNDTPWLDCIKIDKEHHDKLKKILPPTDAKRQ